MTREERVKRDADRILTVIYRLAKGSTKVAVSREQIEAEIERESIFDLTEDQFRAYGRRAYEEAQAHRATALPSTEEKP